MKNSKAVCESVTGPGRPIDREKDQHILQAGHELLYAEGPKAVTMEAVARKAGVSKATLYRRFANSDALIAAVVENKAANLSTGFSLKPDNAEGVRRALNEFGVTLLSFLHSDEHIQFLQGLNASIMLKDTDYQTMYQHGPESTQFRLAAWLDQLHQKNLIDCPEPKTSAERLLGMLLGLNLVRLLYRVEPLPNDCEALEAHVDSIVRQFLMLHQKQ